MTASDTAIVPAREAFHADTRLSSPSWSVDRGLERARSLRVVSVSALVVQEETFTIAEVAEKTGVSAHALRYYERIGLLDVGRQASGHRRFTSHDVDRVVFIGRLR